MSSYEVVKPLLTTHDPARVWHTHGTWLFIEDENMFNAMYAALAEVYNQDQKWGENRVQNGLLWQAILSEETGEVAKEVLEQDNAKMRAELIQVAAVCLNWIKALDRGEVPNWR